LGFTDSMSALKEHLEVGIQQGSDLLSQLTVEQQVFRSVTRLHIVALDEQNESADRAAGEQGDMSIVSSCGAGSSHLYPMPSTPCELGSFQLTVPYNGFPTPCPPAAYEAARYGTAPDSAALPRYNVAMVNFALNSFQCTIRVSMYRVRSLSKKHSECFEFQGSVEVPGRTVWRMR